MPNPLDYFKSAFAAPLAVTAAATVLSEPISMGQLGVHAPQALAFQGVFVYGSGGTTCKAFLQTSFDGGATWCDIACMAFTTASLKKVGAISPVIAAAAPATPTDGTLADNTINNGLLGDRVRFKVISAGTYAGGTTLSLTVVPR